MAKQRGIVAVQCTTRTGERGTYLFQQTDTGHEPLSPVFTSLADLFPWLRDNGWSPVRDSGEPTGVYEK